MAERVKHRSGYHAQPGDEILVHDTGSPHRARRGTVERECEIRPGELIVHFYGDAQSVTHKLRRYEVSIISRR